MKRILVINVKTWGDMVLSLPFLQHLRELYPEAEITLLTGRKGAVVMRCTALPIRVLSWKSVTLEDLRSLIAVDCCYAISPGLLGAGLAYLLRAKERIGFHQATDAKWNGDYFQHREIVPRWRAIVASVLLHRAVIRNLDEQHESLRDFQLLPPAERPTSQRLLCGIGQPSKKEDPGDRVAVLFPYSSAEIRNWPIRRWRDFTRRLLDSGGVDRVRILGESGHEGDLSAAFCGMPQVEVLAGKLCMASVFNEVRDAHLVVANDSLGLHLASLFDRPAVGIFGPNRPQWFGAVSRFARNLYEPMECSPCLQPSGNQCCARGHRTCPGLRRISVDQVFDASQEVLAR